MARLTLYYFGPSAPCRVSLLTARLLDLDVEIKEVNLLKKEQYNEDFLKINPQNTVPALVDNDYVLTESIAIAIYLIESNFPNGHSLYPKDAKNRGIINQRIFYDSTVLLPRLRGIIRPILFSGVTKISDKDRQDLFDAVDYVEKNFFKGNPFIAKTDQPTLADLSMLASIATFVSIGGDLKKYPNIATWYDLCKDLPGNAENLAGAKQLGDAVKKALEEPL